mgnify:FL=1
MADYDELYGIIQDSTLRNKVAVAVAIKAQVYIDGGTPTSDELTWASRAIKNTRSVAAEIMPYVIAANKDSSVAQITGATDAAIQTNVDAAVDALVGGGIT